MTRMLDQSWAGKGRLSDVGQLGTEAFLPLLSFNHMLSISSTVVKILPIWMEAAHSVAQLFVGSGASVGGYSHGSPKNCGARRRRRHKTC